MGTAEVESTRAQRRRAGIARRRAERRVDASAAQARDLPNWELLLPALAGVALAGYLSLVAWWGGTPVACSAGSDCEIVQTSRFASVLGIPVAGWGAAGYAALAWTGWRVRSPRWHGLLALALSAPALAASLSLTAISLFVIGATCIWCLASLGLVAACFVASLRAQPAGLRRAPRPLAAAAVVSLLVLGGLHLSFRSHLAAGPEDPRLRALARHLADSGAIFYGASWCEHCAEQKGLFGAAAHRLPYVECSPNGRRAPQAPVCRRAGIESYPTWLVNGQHFEGVVPPERLARISGFRSGRAGS